MDINTVRINIDNIHVAPLQSYIIYGKNDYATKLSESRVLFPNFSIFGSHDIQTALNFFNDETPIRVISVRCFSFGVEFIVDFTKSRYRDPSMGSRNTNVVPRLNNLADIPFVVVGQYNFDDFGSVISNVGVMLLTHGFQCSEDFGVCSAISRDRVRIVC